MAMSKQELNAWVRENYATSPLKCKEICALFGIHEKALKRAVAECGVRRNVEAGRGRNFTPNKKPQNNWQAQVPAGCELTHNGYLEKSGAKTVHRMVG